MQPHTEMDWEVYPAGLTDILRWIRERYGSIPLYVTENGAAFYDPPRAEGGWSTTPPRELLPRAPACGADAIAAGVDVRGYFAWSLLDNFEWNHGYSNASVCPRGLRHADADLQGQRRSYRDIISQSGIRGPLTLTLSRRRW